jgi:hypothetical protein
VSNPDTYAPFLEDRIDLISSSLDYIEKQRADLGLEPIEALDQELGVWALKGASLIPESSIPKDYDPSTKLPEPLLSELVHVDYIDLVLTVWAIKHRIVAKNRDLVISDSLFSSEIFDDDERTLILQHRWRWKKIFADTGYLPAPAPIELSSDEQETKEYEAQPAS